MAGASKVLLLFVLFSLSLAGIRGGAVVEVDEAETLISELEASLTSESEEPLVPELAASLKSSESEESKKTESEASPTLELDEPLISELEAALTAGLEEPRESELEDLRSKIAALESKISEGKLQIEAMDETLVEYENVIEDKVEIIASLEAEIESVQEKRDVDLAEVEEKAHTRTAELEKQIIKLEGDIQAQVHKRDAFEARAVEAERKVDELNLILESLQKTNDEQKKRIKNAQLALKKAEEELMKALLEATSKKKELTKIHGAWLSPWLSAHLGHCQATAAAHWNEHVKPSYDTFLQKVSEVLSLALKKVEPHLETAKEKWIPTLKQHCVRVRLRTSIEPYAQSMTTKALKFYETSAVTLKSHVARVQDIAVPYFQEAKKFSGLYIDQVAKITKPHVEKVQTALKTYTEQVVHASGKFLKLARTFHHQSKTEEKSQDACKSCS